MKRALTLVTGEAVPTHAHVHCLQEGDFLRVYFLHTAPQGVVCRAHYGTEKLPTGYPASNPLGLIFLTVSSYCQPLNMFEPLLSIHSAHRYIQL